ncbi:hypothetical protein QE152_g39210 [Popillia japonica]|uniref:Uncharacterized protein n=1 Tax=Popillia japonica TaxID=7064 RepID=A0AAW1HV91_POPJA
MALRKLKTCHGATMGFRRMINPTWSDTDLQRFDKVKMIFALYRRMINPTWSDTDLQRKAITTRASLYAIDVIINATTLSPVTLPPRKAITTRASLYAIDVIINATTLSPVTLPPAT